MPQFGFFSGINVYFNQSFHINLSNMSCLNSNNKIVLFARKDQLPERGNAQWTDAFYRGRRSSRIQVLTGLAEPDLISSLSHILQVFDAAPGTYYLLLECKQTLHNLGLTLTLGDTDYLRCHTTHFAETRTTVCPTCDGIPLQAHCFQKDGGFEEWAA